MSAPDALTRALSGSGPILLDFDGPVCSIFAGYPATQVAEELRLLLMSHGVEISTPISEEPDPLAILRWTADLCRPALTGAVEDALRAEELRAAATAEPTPYAREVVVAARQANRPVAIVSNNSEPAIAAFLASCRLLDYIAPIIGRAHSEPTRMKPDPGSLLAAAASLDAAPGACVLIGDSESDVDAARAAGMPVIALANKTGKAERFEALGADVVVTSMEPIAAALISETER